MPRVEDMLPAPHEIPIHSRDRSQALLPPGFAPGRGTSLLRTSKGLCSLVCHFNTLAKCLPHARYRVSAEATEKDKKLAPKGLAYSWGGGRGQEEVHSPSAMHGGMGRALGVRGEADLGLDAGRGHPSCTCRWRKREPGKAQRDWETQAGGTCWEPGLPTENTHRSLYLPVELLSNGCEWPASCEHWKALEYTQSLEPG